jgi:hypothetical protein
VSGDVTDPAADSPSPPETSPDTVSSSSSSSSSSVASTPTPPPLWQARAWWVARVVAGLALLAYFVEVLQVRMAGAHKPYAIDGDQAQAVFQYWRYHHDGAMAPGHLLTDYAFVMHAPPGWWALMASLSTVVEPLVAAKVLQVVAWAGLVVAVVWAVGRRTEWIVGMAAAALVLRSPDLMQVSAGGYARSFGPVLVALFFGAFLAQRHALVLAVLVVQAALYPSVVVPCGLTYGVYCLVKGPMKARLRRCGTLAIAGLVIIGFGKSQDLAAPAWWGKMVSYEQAATMPAWGPSGRVPEVPLKPADMQLRQSLDRAFRDEGFIGAPTAVRALLLPDSRFLVVPGLLALAAVAVDRVLRRRRHGPPPDADERFPWQGFALGIGIVVAYFLVRAVAFRAYLPVRQLAHTVPFVLPMTFVLVTWCGARAVVGRCRALSTVLTLVFAVAPTFALRGTGIGNTSSYKDFGIDRPFFKAVRKLPLDAEIACDTYVCDMVGIFSYHHPYANRLLTHPFRLGYYAESERRLITMMKALYATSWAPLVEFARQEHVGYFAYTKAKLAKREPRIYEPARREIDAAFRAARGKQMVLMNPPKQAVVFAWRTFVIVDLAKLTALFDAGKLTDPPPPPPATTTATTTAPAADDGDDTADVPDVPDVGTATAPD